MNPATADAHLPERLLDWFLSERRGLFQDLSKGRQVRFLGAHLPVLATWDNGRNFPVNLSVKGVGLIPRKDLMGGFARSFQEIYEAASERPWKESLPDRISALSDLYSQRDNFDASLLGGLEIFERQTRKNLLRNPVASLLFTGLSDSGPRMQYLSFQVDARVEILEIDDPYYMFLLSARKLFEYERFHLPQPDYPSGYLFTVTKVTDKSPRIKER